MVSNRRVHAERSAHDILQTLGIDRPPVDVADVANRLNLRVVYESLPSDTSAVLIRQPYDRHVIGVNANHAPTRQRFSIAHEIAHATLHFPSQPPKSAEAVVDRPLEVLFRDGVAAQGSDRREVEANAFAAVLLMPTELVRTELRRLWEQSRVRSTDGIVAQLASNFEVSEQAMRFRLVNLGLMDPA